jgi:hypothetical protein
VIAKLVSQLPHAFNRIHLGSERRQILAMKNQSALRIDAAGSAGFLRESRVNACGDRQPATLLPQIPRFGR